MIRPGTVFLAIYSIFVKPEHDGGKFAEYLEFLRERFHDTATFHYPWCDLTTHPNRRRRRLGPEFKSN